MTSRSTSPARTAPAAGHGSSWALAAATAPSSRAQDRDAASRERSSHGLLGGVMELTSCPVPEGSRYSARTGEADGPGATRLVRHRAGVAGYRRSRSSCFLAS